MDKEDKKLHMFIFLTAKAAIEKMLIKEEKKLEKLQAKSYMLTQGESGHTKNAKQTYTSVWNERYLEMCIDSISEYKNALKKIEEEIDLIK